MKIRTNKKILFTSGIGLGLILIGVLAFQSQTYSKALFFVGLNLIFIGLFMIIAPLYFATKPKTELVVDERVEGINNKAGNSAFWMVIFSVTVFFWGNAIWSLDLDLKDMYTMIILVGIYSYFIFRWYYNRGERQHETCKAEYEG
ncbi:MAG TPA: DUF2178 domain-containing protein [Methanosarcinaceae archaeon]|nr:DUF2178 domain-containing protein [Methanosarcinaceae archaeon]